MSSLFDELNGPSVHTVDVSFEQMGSIAGTGFGRHTLVVAATRDNRGSGDAGLLGKCLVLHDGGGEGLNSLLQASYSAFNMLPDATQRGLINDTTQAFIQQEQGGGGGSGGRDPNANRLAKGDRIEIPWDMSEGDDCWYAGCVSAVTATHIAVQYDDDDGEPPVRYEKAQMEHGTTWRFCERHVRKVRAVSPCSATGFPGFPGCGGGGGGGGGGVEGDGDGGGSDYGDDGQDMEVEVMSVGEWSSRLQVLCKPTYPASVMATWGMVEGRRSS
jgi:hypothetical protein